MINSRVKQEQHGAHAYKRPLEWFDDTLTKTKPVRYVCMCSVLVCVSEMMEMSWAYLALSLLQRAQVRAALWVLGSHVTLSTPTRGWMVDIKGWRIIEPVTTTANLHIPADHRPQTVGLSIYPLLPFPFNQAGGFNCILSDGTIAALPKDKAAR